MYAIRKSTFSFKLYIPERALTNNLIIKWIKLKKKMLAIDVLIKNNHNIQKNMFREFILYLSFVFDEKKYK
jgi:hypothetical protein